jgi:hypothetical protein
VALFPGLSVLGYAPGVRERRAHDRRRVDEEAQLIIPSDFISLPCRVLNISKHGAGIQCDVVPHADTRVRLLMKDGREFEAVTAWFEGGLLGLRFLTAADGE